jgi:hypothetical protein
VNSIEVNDIMIWSKMKNISKLSNIEFVKDNKHHIIFNVGTGEWIFTARI